MLAIKNGKIFKILYENKMDFAILFPQRVSLFNERDASDVFAHKHNFILWAVEERQ